MTPNTKLPKPSSIAIAIEVILGILGFYGIGHLMSKRWMAGVGFLLFSFLWLFIEGITKDIFLAGNYPAGLCALAFHLPVMLISVSILRK